eukprot:SAG22_NODE_539_length_9317_cov_4.771209_5_plen_1329_part_00
MATVAPFSPAGEPLCAPPPRPESVAMGMGMELHLAAAAGDAGRVQLLLEAAAEAEMTGDDDDPRLDINQTSVVDERFGHPETALGVAARLGHTQVIQALLPHGARVDAVHFLHACRNGHSAVVNALAGMPAVSAKDREAQEAVRAAELYARELEESTEFRVIEALSSAETAAAEAVSSHRTAQRALHAWRASVRLQIRLLHGAQRAGRHLSSRLLAKAFLRWERHTRARVLGAATQASAQQSIRSEQLHQVVHERQAAVERALQTFHEHFLCERRPPEGEEPPADAAAAAQQWTAEAACAAAGQLLQQQRDGGSRHIAAQSLAGGCFSRWRNHTQRVVQHRLKITLDTREQELEITSKALERHVHALNECTANFLKLQQDHERLQRESESCVQRDASVLDATVALLANGDRKALMLRAFVQLQQHSLHARRVRNVGARAISRMLQQRLSRCFVTWAASSRHESSARVGQQRETLERMLRAQEVQLAEKDNALRTVSQGAARMECKVADQLAYIAMQREANLEEKQVRLERTISRWLELAMASAFEAWLRIHRQRRKAVTAIKRLLQRNLARAFLCWIDMSSTQRRMTSVMTKILLRFRHRAIAAAFVQWVDSAAAQKHVQATARRVLNRFVQRSLSMAFMRWSEMAITQRQLTSQMIKVARRFSTRRTYAAFSQWAEHVNEMIRQKTVVDRVLTRMAHAAVLGSFTRWAEFCVELSRQRAVVDRVLRRMAQSAVSGAWVAWVTYTATAQRNRFCITKILLRMTHSLLMHGFERWAAMANEKLRQRTVVGKILRRMQSMAVAGAFARWIESIEQEQHRAHIMSKIIQHMAQAAVLGSFTRWAEFCVELSRQRAVVDRVLRRMAHAAVLGSFTRWAEFCVELSRQRAVVDKVLRRMAQSAVSGAWVTWVTYTATAQRNRFCITKILLRMTHSLLMHGFERWAAMANEKLRQRTVVGKILRRMQSMTVAGAFAKWHECVDYTRQENLRAAAEAATQLQTVQLAKQQTETEQLRSELLVARQHAAEKESEQSLRISNHQDQIVLVERMNASSGAESQALDETTNINAHSHKLERQLKHLLLMAKKTNERAAEQTTALQQKLRAANEAWNSRIQSCRTIGTMHLRMRVSLAAVRRHFERWASRTVRQLLGYQLSIGVRVEKRLHSLSKATQLKRMLCSWRVVVREAVRTRTNTIYRHLDAVSASQTGRISHLRNGTMRQVARTNLLRCRIVFIRWFSEAMLPKQILQKLEATTARANARGVLAIPGAVSVFIGWKRRAYWRQKAVLKAWTATSTRAAKTKSAFEASNGEVELLGALVRELTSQCDRLTKAATN